MGNKGCEPRNFPSLAPWAAGRGGHGACWQAPLVMELKGTRALELAGQRRGEERQLRGSSGISPWKTQQDTPVRGNEATGKGRGALRTYFRWSLPYPTSGALNNLGYLCSLLSPPLTPTTLKRTHFQLQFRRRRFMLHLVVSLMYL